MWRDEDEGFCDISEDHTIADPEVVLSTPSSTLTLGSSTLVPDPTQSPSSPGPSGTAVSPVAYETSVSPLPSEPEDAGQDNDEETVSATPLYYFKYTRKIQTWMDQHLLLTTALNQDFAQILN